MPTTNEQIASVIARVFNVAGEKIAGLFVEQLAELNGDIDLCEVVDHIEGIVYPLCEGLDYHKTEHESYESGWGRICDENSALLNKVRRLQRQVKKLEQASIREGGT